MKYTYHLKNPKKPGEYKVVRAIKKIYNLKELKTQIKQGLTLEGPAVVADSDKAILEFLKTSYEKKEVIGAGEGRSRELYYVGTDCYKWGLTQTTALETAHWFNTTVFVTPEASSVVDHQVKSAYKYTKEPFGEYRENLKTANTETKRQIQFRDHVENQRLRTELKDMVYIKETEKLYDLTTGLGYTKTQIKTHMLYKYHTKKAKDDIVYHRLVKMVDREDFRPDKPDRFYKENKIEYVNRYTHYEIELVSLTTTKAKQIVKKFEEHIRYLATSEYEYNTLLNVFAFMLQNPGKKIPWAVLISSKYEGVGKSMLEFLFRKFYKNYVGTLDNSHLHGGFTEFIVDKLVLFVHELFQTDRLDTMNKLKNLITERTIRINEKNVRSYEGTNCANFFLFTNKSNAIYTDKYDRRYFVIRNEKEPKPQRYYDTLLDIFENDYEIIYTYLVARDLTNFNVNKRPQMTAGKKLMIEQSETELALFLQSLRVNPGHSPFAKPLFKSSDILYHIEMHGPKVVSGRSGIKAVTQFLVEAGYEQRNIKYRADSKSTSLNVWCGDWSKITNASETVKEVFEIDEENKKEVF